VNIYDYYYYYYADLKHDGILPLLLHILNKQFKAGELRACHIATGRRNQKLRCRDMDVVET
jgi:hypothetical protein